MLLLVCYVENRLMFFIKKILITFSFWAATVAGCEAGQMSINSSSVGFSVREVVAYHCVETVDPKFEKLLCVALSDFLLEKGALAKSGKGHLANGIHIKLSLESVTEYSILGSMEWTKCKDKKCAPWTKTRAISTFIMDSVVSPSTYREFIIGLFIDAENSMETD